MSGNTPTSKNSHKMCKTPTKQLVHQQIKQTTKLELGTYEVLNTNCTLVGSNNLTLDTKLSGGNVGYQPPKINICTTSSSGSSTKLIEQQQQQGKNVVVMKKPQSPRSSIQLDHHFVHNQMTSPKFNFNQLNNRTINQNVQQQQQQQAQQKLNYETNPVVQSVHNIIHNVHNIPITTTSNFLSQQSQLQQQQQQRIITTTTTTIPTTPTTIPPVVPVVTNYINNPSTINNLPNLNSLTNLNNGVGLCANMSPTTFSNPSPSNNNNNNNNSNNNYPTNAVSPYNVQISSPANSVSSITSCVAGMKSPVASPQQHIRPQTPQPILPQAFQQIPVMTSGPNLVQIIHAPPPNSAPTYQNHSVIARQTIIAPPTQNIQPPSPMIKIKPPQNILPKPPSTGNSPQVTTKPVRQSQNPPTPQQIQQTSPAQIVLPNQTILPATQPGTLLLNQMPLIVQQNTAHGVQLILRPSTPNSASQIAAGKLGASQNLILQQAPAPGAPGQVILQHGSQRGATLQQPQQLVRVVTANGMIQHLAPTYIAMNNQALNIQQLAQPQHIHTSQQQQQQHHHQNKPQIINAGGGQHQSLINACLTSSPQPSQQQQQQQPVIEQQQQQLPPPKRKPKKKKKNKEPPKLDLGSIMKLSGIGDDDDMFETEMETTQSENVQKVVVQNVQKSEPSVVTGDNEFNIIPKRIGNIHITGINQDNSPNKSNNNNNNSSGLAEKPVTGFGQSQISVQQSLNDINAINQNLAQIGLISQNIHNSSQNFISSNSQILSQINTSSQSVQNLSLSSLSSQSVQNLSLNVQNASNNSLINQDGQNLASFLQALNNQGQNFSLINSQSLQSISGVVTSQAVTNLPGISFPNSSQQPQVAISTLQNQKYQSVQNVQNVQSVQNVQTTSNPNFTNILNSLSDKTNQNFAQTVHQKQQQQQNNLVQTVPTHFNIPNAIPNIQVQNFCTSNNPNLILNHQATANAILTHPNIHPNIPNFTLNNGMIPNANLALPNFLQANTIVQPTSDINNFANNSMQQRSGGFKLALSEDGRLILQHDPNLNQDIQSQLLLQSIFGINLQGGNLVLTSVNNHTVATKPVPEVVKKITETSTKTTSIIQNVIPSVKTSEPQQQDQQVAQNPPNNFSYIVNLTPEQLETLKRNGQLTVNGQTIFMHRPTNPEKNLNKSPKPNKSTTTTTTTIKKKQPPNQFEQPINKKPQTPPISSPKLQTSQSVQTSQNVVQTQPNQTIINQLQSPNLQDLQQAIKPQQESPPPPPVKPIKEPSQDLFPESKIPFMNGSDHPNHIEQFLSNLNINPTNLGQLISQKLNQELPNVDHKIVNIQPGPSAGQLVAKIDISSSDNMQQILAGETPPDNLIVPQLIQMNVKQESEIFQPPQPTTSQENHQPQPQQQQQQQQLPALIIGGNVLHQQGNDPSQDNLNLKSNTVYQRIQTIQLTPQKQQLLKSVQLQIQALTARLQQKDATKQSTDHKNDQNVPENDIHTALRHLYIEQQKILATGKILPTISQPISSINCNMETISTQSVPVTAGSKNNGTFLTSLLQQPVVSVNQSQKVYYHNGNQIIAISPTTNWQQTQNILPNTVVTPSISVVNTSNNQNSPVFSQSSTSAATTIINSMNTTSSQTTGLIAKPKKLIPLTTAANSPICSSSSSSPPSATSSSSITLTTNLTPIPIKVPVPPVVTNEKLCQISSSPIKLETCPTNVSLLSPSKRVLKPSYSKSQLIEHQLQTDQNGANNPDIKTPFASKSDACKRLVRYHCYNQPVLSQKDLDKADEIFELTAKHFMGKYQGMLNKYKYLLLKESMREVQTSELMMIDRMFLAEEQQSFLKLQADYKLQNELELQEHNVEFPTTTTATTTTATTTTATTKVCNNKYEEDVKPIPSDFQLPDDLIIDRRQFIVKQENCETDKLEEPRYDDSTNTDFNIKCGLNYFSDESCDSSSNFQVYEDSPKQFDEEFLNSDVKKLDKSAGKNGMESYNTTKIIGNFEIEINNKGCNNQESYTKNFRQKIIDNNKTESSRKLDENFGQKSDDYDEWLCIQRELGYFPETNKSDHHHHHHHHDSKTDQSDSSAINSDNKQDEVFIKKSGGVSHKRSTSDSSSSRLETLKKFRVEKHNSKSKKSGSIIGEVKFEVRIEHKKVFAEQTTKKESSGSKRTHYDYPPSKLESSDIYNNSKRVCTQFQPSLQIKQEDAYLDDDDDSPTELHETSHEDQFDTSIDEQVQSAIDSILNLQQIASMSATSTTTSSSSIEKSDASTVTTTTTAVAAATTTTTSTTQSVTCRNINTLTSFPAKNIDANNSDLVSFSSRTINDTFSDTSDTLDEAVKSILS